MARLLALLGLLLVALAPHVALARAQHAPASFFCPFGAAGLDGCGQAPQNALTPGLTGTWQHADCFGDVAGAGNGYINQWSGTATDYTHATGLHPTNHNTAGCDFPIGALNTVHGDPQTTNLTPYGCVYNDPGLHTPTGSPSVDCTDSVWTGTLPPLDFTANVNHGCVSINLPVNAAAGVTDAYLTDLIFQDTTGSCGAGAQSSFIAQVGAHTYNLHLKSLFFHSLGLAARQFTGAVQNIYGGNGVVDMTFVITENSSGRGVGYAGAGSLALYDSALFGWSPYNPSSHGEWLAAATQTPTTFIYHDLTQINYTSQMVFQTAPITCCLGVTGAVPLFELMNSMTVNAFPGGATVNTTITACVGGAPPVAGVCDMTTHGSNLYVLTSTGTVGTGENLSCARNGIVALGTNVSGGTSAGPGGGFNGGAGSVWGLDTEAGISGFVGSTVGNAFTVTTAGDADLQGPTSTGLNYTIIRPAAGTTLTAGVSNGSGAAGNQLLIGTNSAPATLAGSATPGGPTTISGTNTQNATGGVSNGSGAAGTQLTTTAGLITLLPGSKVSGSNSKVLTATATATSNQLAVTGATGITLVIGTAITGTNIPANTTISALGVVGGAAYTLSANTTGSVSNPTATNAIPANTTVASGGPTKIGTVTISASAFVDTGSTITVTNTLASTTVATAQAPVQSGTVTLTSSTGFLDPGSTVTIFNPFSSRNILSVNAGVGGVGTYTFDGAAQTTLSQILQLTTIPNWMANGSAPGISGWSMAPQTCNETIHARGDPGGAIAGASVSAPTVMTNSTITNNIIDLAVSGGPNQIIIFAPGNTTCTNKTKFGDNQDPSGFDLTSTMNAWTAQSSVNCN